MTEYTATLNCRSRIDGKHHKITFSISPPTFGETVYCFRCAAMSRVIFAPYEYVGRCEDCAYVSPRDTRRTYVYNLTDSHARSKPGHHVALWRGRKRVVGWSKISEKVS